MPTDRFENFTYNYEYDHQDNIDADIERKEIADTPTNQQIENGSESQGSDFTFEDISSSRSNNIEDGEIIVFEK